MSATCKNKKSSYVRKGERSEPKFFSSIFVGDNKNNKISVLKGERSEPKIFVLLSKNELLFNISAQYVIVLDILHIYRQNSKYSDKHQNKGFSAMKTGGGRKGIPTPPHF